MPGDHSDDSTSDCAQELMNQGHDKDSAYAICEASTEGKSFEETDLSHVLKQSGLSDWSDTVAKLVNSDVEASVISEVINRAKAGQSHESAHKAMAKSAKLEKIGFEAEMRSQFTVFKASDDDFVIWGPASVEIVDKEGDKIQAKALQKALPQLLKRARLSLEHSDQLVGRILERFETEEPVTVEIDGKTFKRSDFPTEVLELDGMEPALYVSGEIWDDSRQSRETRQRIENGELQSYSISGEALVTRKRISSDGETYDDIVDIDLSAVTLCEEGMNQKAKFAQLQESGEKVKATAEKSDDPDGSGEAPTVSAVASIAKEAISKTMSESEEKSGDNPEGGFSLEALQSEFKSVLDEKLPDGELATKDDTLTREDVEGIAQEVYQKQEDTAGEEDQVDSGHSEAAGRPGEEADVSGEEADISGQAEPHDGTEKQEDEAGDEDMQDSGTSDAAGRPGDETDYPDTQGDAPDSEGEDVDKQALSALASELGVEEKTLVELKQLFSGKGDDEEEFFTDEEYDEEYEEAGYDEDAHVPGEEEEEEPDAAGRDYVEQDPEAEEEEVVDDEEAVDDYAVDEDVPPEEGYDEEDVDDEEELDVVEAEGYSAEELEEQLPADVWEVVREYLDEEGGMGAEEAPGEEEVMAAAKSDDIETAVEKILSGSGLTKAQGADTPNADVEKSYDDEEPEAKHGNNPALANFY